MMSSTPAAGAEGDAAPRVVDSHLHLWDPELLDYAWLSGERRRRFGPEELAEVVGAPMPTSTFVFVQADCAPAQARDEVRWVASLAPAVGIRGIVAFAALERGDAVRDELEQLRAESLVVGVRRLLQSEPAGFATSPSFLAGARALAETGLTFDACVQASQLPDVVALADAVPSLRIVLDHLGKPEVGSPEHPADPRGTAWHETFRALAERPHVVAKLSGLPSQSAGGRWSREQLAPFVDAALDAFGPERLLFGSDWPVSTPYADWRDFVGAEVGRLAGGEGLARVMAGTAEEFYRLG